MSNLEWATDSENKQHAYDTGLKKMGEEHGRAKLTNELALYVRENPDNLTQEELGAMFGLHPSAISLIQLGKNFKGIGGTVRQPKKRSPNVPEETKQRIRADWATGNFTKTQLARKYGYCLSTICNIVNES